MAFLRPVLLFIFAMVATCSSVLVPTEDMKISELDVKSHSFKPLCSTRPSPPTNGRVRDVGSDRATVLFDWSHKAGDCEASYLQYELLIRNRFLFSVAFSLNTSNVRGLVLKDFESNTPYDQYLFSGTEDHTRSGAIRVPFKTLNATTNSNHQDDIQSLDWMSYSSLHPNCTKGRVTPPRNGVVSHLSSTSATYSYDWAWDKENDCFSSYQATNLFEKASRKLVAHTFGLNRGFRGVVYNNLIKGTEYYTESFTYRTGSKRIDSTKLVSSFRTPN